MTSESSGCRSRAIREGFAFFEQKKHCKKLRKLLFVENPDRTLNLIADGSGSTA